MNPKILIVVFSTFLLFANLVLAAITPPGVPHQFYGTVTLNGSPPPDGTTVTAKIDGEPIASTTTKNGKYGYDPVFYVEDLENNFCIPLCPEVNFFVNEIDTGQTKYFCNGCSTELDLTASAPSEPGQPSGPSGPSGPSPTPEEEEEEEIIIECQERWGCAEWSECIDNVQTRTCRDVNSCGTELDRPLESQPCVVEEEKEEEEVPTAPPTPSDQITGMLAALTENPGYLLILSLIVIAIILIIFRSRLKPVKKKGLAFLAKINFKSNKK